MSSYNLKKASAFIILFLLSACGGDSNPKFAGVKIGKPYEINGKTYRPAPDSTYDKIGDASWYGPGFHGKRTASGEIFDQNDITAAHPTLPIPSLVRVTNIANEKSLVVRINDRGPFHGNRIIDLSKRAAELLDVRSVKPVRVQFLDRETKEYISSIQGISPRIDMVAYNENYTNKVKEDPISENIEIASDSNSTEIQNFAPVQSVESSDLEKPSKSGGFLIRDAAADDKNLSSDQDALYKQATQAPETKKTVVQKEIPEVKSPIETVIKNEPSARKSNEKYVILAGSFSSQDNAKKLVRSLSDLDNHQKLVVIDKVKVMGKDWWRVHVGPFTDSNKAEQALEIVREAGVRDARISRQK